MHEDGLVSPSKGPNVCPHSLQSYAVALIIGCTPVRRVTTPETRTKLFKSPCRKSRRRSEMGSWEVCMEGGMFKRKEGVRKKGVGEYVIISMYVKSCVCW